MKRKIGFIAAAIGRNKKKIVLARSTRRYFTPARFQNLPVFTAEKCVMTNAAIEILVIVLFSDLYYFPGSSRPFLCGTLRIK